SADRPQPHFLEVGEDWAEACGDHWAGIREPFVAAMLEDCLPVMPGVNYLGRSTSIILAGGSES
ncbi:MAG: hypothetical protein AB7S63_16270, partial [Thauera sp.]